MKQLCLLILLIVSVKASAQIDKSQWLIGGNAAFSYAHSKELKMSTLQLSPAGGYFFKDKLAGGLRFNMGAETYNWIDEKFRYSDFAIAPFLRYYFLLSAQKVNIFTDAAYGFAWSKYKNITYSNSYTYRYHTLSLMAGPAIFLNKHTALEVTVGYTYSTRGPVDSSITNTIRTGIGLQIHFGKN